MTFYKKMIDRISLRLKKNNKNLTKSNMYSDLAPIDTIDPDSEYLHALDWAINNDRIKNIAIAGPYGSGKSSIIRSYLKYNSNLRRKAINISLAAFESDIKKEDNEKPAITEALENGVLKQLFYKVNQKKIPQSRYRKLHKIKISSVYLSFSSILFLLLLMTAIFAPDFFINQVTKIEKAGKIINISNCISVILFIIVMLISIYPISKLFVKLFSNAQIKEIKLPTDTTINNTFDQNVIFNKNMDEIMYFFEATKYNIVFFEDLDRFDDSEIFVRLRELNILLNNDENIERRIIFVYAIKDDMFIHEDRTKFFDFIIPVIPVMNPTNSGDYLIDKLNLDSNNKIYNISQEYILDVSPYISDMRILKNIYNEFIMYKMTLSEKQNLNLKDEEMLSLIIFKNLYPKEFANLQAEKGIIKDAFNSVNKKKLEVSQKERDSIKNDEDLLDTVQHSLLKENKEIKVSMLSAITDWQGVVYEITINQQRFTANQILDDSFDLNNLSSDRNCTIHYYTLNNNFRNSNSTTISSGLIKPYIARWNNHIKTIDDKKDRIKHRIEDSKEQLKTIGSLSLKKLIEAYGVERILAPHVLNNKLLTFMLRRGYINEKYSNYINFFKEQTLTNNDMNFILSVKDQQPLSFDYPLTKTDMIINRLQEYEFGYRAIYNFDILEKLLSTEKDNHNKLITFITQLSKDEESWDFIDGFIEKTAHKDILIKHISKVFEDFWELIYNNSSLTYEKQVKYLRLIFEFANIEDIIEQNSEDSISKFMTENDDILKRLFEQSDDFCLSISKMKSIIKQLDIKFECLISDALPKELLDYIFDNCFYIINKHMIKEIVRNKEPQLLEELTERNYTTIRKLQYEPLIDYIDKNLSHYVNSIFFDEKNIHEDQSTIEFFVKKYLTDSDTLSHIISHENFCITNLHEFCGDLLYDSDNYLKMIWDQILSEKKMNIQWDNVMVYWNRLGFSNELSDFVFKNFDILQRSDNSCITDKFISDLIINDFDDNKSEVLLKSKEYSISEIPFEKISYNKMIILIKLKYVSFSLDNYALFEKLVPTVLPFFISHNQTDFIEELENISISSELFMSLLRDDTIQSDLKQHLIDMYAIDNMNNELASYICQNEYTISKNIFLKIWNYLNENEKNTIFLKHYRLLNNENIERCFLDLNGFYPNFSDRTRRHRVEIEYDNNVISLIKYLKESEYITSYQIIDNNKKIICNIKSTT